MYKMGRYSKADFVKARLIQDNGHLRHRIYKRNLFYTEEALGFDDSNTQLLI